MAKREHRLKTQKIEPSGQWFIFTVYGSLHQPKMYLPESTYPWSFPTREAALIKIKDMYDIGQCTRQTRFIVIPAGMEYVCNEHVVIEGEYREYALFINTYLSKEETGKWKPNCQKFANYFIGVVRARDAREAKSCIVCPKYYPRDRVFAILIKDPTKKLADPRFVGMPLMHYQEPTRHWYEGVSQITLTNSVDSYDWKVLCPSNINYDGIPIELQKAFSEIEQQRGTQQ